MASDALAPVAAAILDRVVGYPVADAQTLEAHAIRDAGALTDPNQEPPIDFHQIVFYASDHTGAILHGSPSDVAASHVRHGHCRSWALKLLLALALLALLQFSISESKEAVGLSNLSIEPIKRALQTGQLRGSSIDVGVEFG